MSVTLTFDGAMRYVWVLDRICPGKELADSSVFMAVAMSLAVFDVSKARDARGVEIEPANEVLSGAVRYVFLKYPLPLLPLHSTILPTLPPYNSSFSNSIASCPS